MSVARSVHDVLSDHVQFEVECIDRMYVNVYVPQLQYAAGLVGYVHRGSGTYDRLDCASARITDASVLRCAASLATTGCRGSTSPRANAKTM